MRLLTLFLIMPIMAWADAAIYASPRPSSNLSCPELFEILNKRKPATIDALLAEIAKVKPDYLCHHTEAYGSHSLHESSFANPRALVFGGDAKTIISFNGSKEQDRYERLEVMCFSDQTKKFTFHDIAFPKDRGTKTDLTDLAPYLRARANVISPPNGHIAGQKCSDCHQEPSRPNWHRYPYWPGFCGSNDDNAGGKAYIDAASTEQKKCAEFEQKLGGGAKGKFERYRWLCPRKPGDRPNLELGADLAVLNGWRIAEELRVKGLGARKYEFARNLYCAYGSAELEYIESTGDLRLKKPIDPRVLEMIRNQISEYNSKLSTTRSQLGNGIASATFDAESSRRLIEHYGLDPKTLPGAMDAVDVEGVAQLAALERIVKPLGIDITNWSMVTNGGYSHSNGMIVTSTLGFGLGVPFAETFFADEPQLKGLAHAYHQAAVNYDSDAYHQKSQELCALIDKRIAQMTSGAEASGPAPKTAN